MYGGQVVAAVVKESVGFYGSISFPAVMLSVVLALGIDHRTVQPPGGSYPLNMSFHMLKQDVTH